MSIAHTGLPPSHCATAPCCQTASRFSLLSCHRVNHLTDLRQAGDIVAQLKAGIALKCVVVRDGSEQEIEARDLVPGDITVLEEGQTIAADAKVCAYYLFDRLLTNTLLLCHR